MIVKQQAILRNLTLISGKYDLAMESPALDASIEAELYSKMAIIELCGWIEETVDAMLVDYVKNTIPNVDIQTTLKEEIIDNVYGVRYKTDFRPLMEKIIGAGQFQKIMRRLQRIRSRDTLLQNELAELTKARNRAAHTYWRGEGQVTFIAPSQTMNHFKTLFPIFKSIERMLKNLVQSRQTQKGKGPQGRLVQAGLAINPCGPA